MGHLMLGNVGAGDHRRRESADPFVKYGFPAIRRRSCTNRATASNPARSCCTFTTIDATAMFNLQKRIHGLLRWKHRKLTARILQDRFADCEKARVRLPAPEWLLDYRKAWLAADIIAGLTAAAVVIPKALAYATVAGLPVQVGLYTALVPMVDLRAARHVAAAQREHHDAPLPSSPEWRWGKPFRPEMRGNSSRATAALTFLVGAILMLAGTAAPGLRCQFHLGAGAGRFQGRDRSRHRAGPDPEAARAFISRRARFGHNVLAIIEGYAAGRPLPTVAVGHLHRGAAAGHRALASPLARAAGRGGRSGSPLSACSAWTTAMAWRRSAPFRQGYPP